ncbi:Unknown protein [Striga hermonthica]|uniref:Uncharacterized protein n=1 Tax=Striga hermonthica TaxID=68872 RepID=A0A9N7MT07_STRHE|nr:Unknown protein [Striga hermonthica]
MSAAAAGDGLLRGVFDGCIPVRDTGFEHRPYHKNCKCALHKSRGCRGHSSRCGAVSYPIRRTWSEGCLVLMNPAPAPTAPPPSPPVAQGGISRTQTHLVLCREDLEEE